MSLNSRIALAVVALLVYSASPAAAADAHGSADGAGIGAGIGAGLTILGAGVGIGLIGWSALSAIARQPEQAGKIQVNMIVMAALVEGVAIISLLVVCFGLLGKIPNIAG